ncbi:MAG: hypothetical protein ACK5LT_04300 [Lachnospirales bacterium]
MKNFFNYNFLIINVILLIFLIFASIPLLIAYSQRLITAANFDYSLPPTLIICSSLLGLSYLNKK